MYNKAYYDKFPAKSKWRNVKANQYSIMTTSITHSTIDKSEDVKILKTPLISLL